MAGPWVTPEDVKQSLADALKKDVGNLQPYWDRIVGECVTRAYTDLRNYLLGKGYTASQLDQWDDRRQYNLDQALFWCFEIGSRDGQVGQQPQEPPRRLDRIAQLMREAKADPLALSIAGLIVRPGAVTPNDTIGTGQTKLLSDGTDYGSTFGEKARRRNGMNQYGDQITDGW